MKCLLCGKDTHAFESDHWTFKKVCKACMSAIVLAVLACFSEHQPDIFHDVGKRPD